MPDRGLIEYGGFAVSAVSDVVVPGGLSSETAHASSVRLRRRLRLFRVLRVGQRSFLPSCILIVAPPISDVSIFQPFKRAKSLYDTLNTYLVYKACIYLAGAAVLVTCRDLGIQNYWKKKKKKNWRCSLRG